MTRTEYFETAQRLYSEGKISAEAYDALWLNAEEFIDEDDDDRLPKSYAELEYTSEQLESDPIAIEGARFDDMNYRHYMERQEELTWYT